MYDSQECNQYLAVHALRSKGRYKALNETALTGVVCRQEYPLKTFSLCHGERLEEAFLKFKLCVHDIMQVILYCICIGTN